MFVVVVGALSQQPNMTTMVLGVHGIFLADGTYPEHSAQHTQIIKKKTQLSAKKKKKKKKKKCYYKPDE